MPRSLVKIAILCGAVVFTSQGQTAKRPLEFEVASVKPAPPPVPFAAAKGLRYFRSTDERLEVTNDGLADLISFAYGIKYERILAPAWMSQDYFQVMAKLPPGSTKDDTPTMLQKLLADRFQLRVHHDQRVEAVYELIVDRKGPKLRASAPDVPHRGCYGWPGERFCKGSTLGTLAGFISGKASAGMSAHDQAGELVEHTIDRPVVDQTGLNGTYDVDLQWMPPAGLDKPLFFDANGPPRDPSVKADSIFGALEAVGLTLQPAKHSFDILVVDHADRIPSEN